MTKTEFNPDKGKELFNARKFQEAAEFFEECIRNGKCEDWLFNLLGYSYLNLTRYDDASDIFRKMRSLFPGSPRSFVGMARVYDGQRKFDESYHVLKEGLSIFPDSLDIKRGLLLSMYRLNSLEEAFSLMDTVMKDIGQEGIDRDIGLLHVFGLIYERAGELERSEELFLKMKTGFPQHPAGYSVLANLRARSGSIVEALRDWEKATGIFPDHNDIFRSYCTLLSLLGKPEAANRLLLSNKLLKENPILWTDILRNLERLRDNKRFADCFRELLYNFPKLEVNNYIRSIQSTHSDLPWVKLACRSEKISILPVRVLLLASILSLNERKWTDGLIYLNDFETHPEFVPRWKNETLDLKVKCLISLGKLQELDAILDSMPEGEISGPILSQWAFTYGHRYMKDAALSKVELLEKRAIKGLDIHGGFIHLIEKFKGIDAAMDFAKKYLGKSVPLQRYYLHHSLLLGDQALTEALRTPEAVYDLALLFEMVVKAKYLGDWNAIFQLLAKAREYKLISESAVVTWYNLLIEAKAIENLLLTKIGEQVEGYMEMENSLVQIQNLMATEFSILKSEPFSFKAFLATSHNPKMMEDFSMLNLNSLRFIQENFSRTFLNTYVKFEDALAIAREIRNRIFNEIPTSMIRLGDGEGILLAGTNESEKQNAIDLRKMQRLWWGAEILEQPEINQLVSDLHEAIIGADILGVPGWNRVIRDLSGFRGEVRNESCRGILHVHDAVRSIGQNNEEMLQSQIITSAHLPMDLNYWNLYDYILSGVNMCTVISSHSGLSAVLCERFGFEKVDMIRIPGEFAFLKDRQKNGYVPAYPKRHVEILRDLGGGCNGLYLVAAGILGKLYCQRIKDMGGIALDIGALADYWLGYSTRSAKLNSRPVLDPYMGELSKPPNPGWWTRFLGIFPKMFSPKSDYLVLSTFRTSSQKRLYVLSETVVRFSPGINGEYETMYYVSRINRLGMEEYGIVEDVPGGHGHRIIRTSEYNLSSPVFFRFYAYPSHHEESQIQCVGVNKIDCWIDGEDASFQSVFYPLKDTEYHQDIRVEVNSAFLNRKENPKISIVMTYYHRREQLEYTLKTISWSKFDMSLLEIIIVDDGSSAAQSLSELILNVSIATKLIFLGPDYKRDKNYCNPAIPYNIGFGEAKGETIIIQNPEVCHIGDVIQYTMENINTREYLVFTCANLSSDDLNQEMRSMLKRGDQASIQQLCSFINELSIDDQNGPGFWYSHGIYQASAFHFLTAIKSKNLFSLGGFLEEFAFGFAADDNEFVFRIRNHIKLNVRFIDHQANPFGIHQWHPKFLYFQRNLDLLHFKNRSLLSRLVASEAENQVQI